MEQPLSNSLPFALGGLGTMEMVIILAVVLLLFGARKLPALAESMGASISSFKKGMKSGSESGAISEGKAPAETKRTIEHDSNAH
jgi:TatA/E family protein of Tat protein translocase